MGSHCVGQRIGSNQCAQHSLGASILSRKRKAHHLHGVDFEVVEEANAKKGVSDTKNAKVVLNGLIDAANIKQHTAFVESVNGALKRCEFVLDGQCVGIGEATNKKTAKLVCAQNVVTAFKE